MSGKERTSKIKTPKLQNQINQNESNTQSNTKTCTKIHNHLIIHGTRGNKCLGTNKTAAMNSQPIIKSQRQQFGDLELNPNMGTISSQSFTDSKLTPTKGSKGDQILEKGIKPDEKEKDIKSSINFLMVPPVDYMGRLSSSSTCNISPLSKTNTLSVKDVKIQTCSLTSEIIWKEKPMAEEYVDTTTAESQTSDCDVSHMEDVVVDLSSNNYGKKKQEKFIRLGLRNRNKVLYNSEAQGSVWGIDSKEKGIDTKVSSLKRTYNNMGINSESGDIYMNDLEYYGGIIVPNTLVFIQDTFRSVYHTKLNIRNTSDRIVYYRVYTNHLAAQHYIIEPMNGIVEPKSEVNVHLETKLKKYLIDFNNLMASKDILVVKSVQVSCVQSVVGIKKFWEEVERKSPELIESAYVDTILVLSPTNISSLDAIHDCSEKKFLAKHLLRQYDKSFKPRIDAKLKLYRTFAKIMAIKSSQVRILKGFCSFNLAADIFIVLVFNVFMCLLIFPSVLYSGNQQELVEPETVGFIGVVLKFIQNLWKSIF